jgi:hypothetical protein
VARADVPFRGTPNVAFAYWTLGFRMADHSHPISANHLSMIVFDEKYRYEQCSSKR